MAYLLVNSFSPPCLLFYCFFSCTPYNSTLAFSPYFWSPSGSADTSWKCWCLYTFSAWPELEGSCNLARWLRPLPVYAVPTSWCSTVGKLGLYRLWAQNGLLPAGGSQGYHQLCWTDSEVHRELVAEPSVSGAEEASGSAKSTAPWMPFFSCLKSSDILHFPLSAGKRELT